jgi:L-arabinokinase
VSPPIKSEISIQKSKMQKIAYYITAHGYGHGTRSCDILNALHKTAPEVQLVVKTDLPLAFMQSRLPADIKIIPGAFDVGLIQKDAIQVDLEASLKAVEKLHAHENRLIEGEMNFIASENIGVVVADIPAIPLEAAKRAEVPAIATGNFGWDWIYSDFVKLDPRWQRHVDAFRRVYEQTDLLLRQPFADPMTAFPNRIDLPLLAKPGTDCRERIAQLSGADPRKKWVLLAFTSLNLTPSAVKRLSHFKRCENFTVEPLELADSGIHCLSLSTASFADILASMDVVVTKPGFGIVSECIVNNKPIIYTDRENFLEYPVLVDGIEKYCRHTFLPSAELYAGELGRALDEIDSAPAPLEEMPQGGAEIATAHILQAFDQPPEM